MRKLIFLLFAAGLLVQSCVPVKQMKELREKYDNCTEKREYLVGENERLEAENAEMQAELEKLRDQVDDMVADTSRIGEQRRKMRHEHDRLKELNEELMEAAEKSQAGSEAENRKLMGQLMNMQDELQQKEDRLKVLEQELNQKERNLNRLQKELQEREARVRELEELITQKDEAVRALKDKVKAALTGFADKGITVEQKGGRVYVSMEAKLLFASGSTAVGSEGKTAVRQLSEALEGTEDITILVEGHTDTDPIKTASIKDNWDLSVKRATSVVRIMLNSSDIDPAVLTAAGRGEHFPVAPNDTPEGKAKNRRIEVILTPDLNKLFEILDESAAEISNDQ